MVNIVAIMVAVSACANFHELDVPSSIGVPENKLSFAASQDYKTLTVRSGSKWTIDSLPEWIKVEEINSSRSYQYTWDIVFVATANDEYDREGTIILRAGTETVVISVSQPGKKGKYVAVESVSLSPTKLTLTEGESASLTYEISPSNASVTNVTWKSSNEKVATVSDSGQVKAISEGTAVISVYTENGGKTATCNVTVKAAAISVTGVTLDKTSLSMTVGDTQTLTATVNPSNATDKSVTWSSDNTSIATVSSSGVITAKAAGTAKITVKTNDGGKTATCTVTVKAATIPVTGVSLDKTSLSMTVGETQTLTATVTPSNATNRSVTWSSSNTSIATVSTSGVVTAKTAGTATITVMTNDGGKTATCTVTVKAATISVTGVSLDKTSLSMTVGETQTLTATVTPSNATNRSVTWSSSNTSIATVSTSGVVTAKAAGTATITVKTNDGGKTATCTVTVKEATVPVTGVSLDKTSLSMTVGETQTLTATITPSNASNKSVTWSSNKTSIATVSSSGVVTAKAAGTATITVKTNDGGKTATCTVTVKEATVSVTSVTLDKTSLTMTVGDTQTLTATVNPSNASNKSVTWSSNKTSVATVSSSGVITAKSAGTATITVKTNDGGKTAKCTVTVKNKDVNGSGNENTGEEDLFGVLVPEAVDLGLSVKWASFNLGASKPEEYGNYYAWGETSPKSNYTWDTYKWGNPSTKYNQTDGKVTLEASDDAARVALKGKWRMPTYDEEEELYSNCSRLYTQINGINGYRITGPSGNSIFLPSAGLYDGSSYCSNQNSGGWYWSSSLCTVTYASGFYFASSYFYTGNHQHERSDGHVIRPVYAE